MSNLPVLAGHSDLEQMADPAHYVELACERAKAWLSDALAHGDIDQIVEIKSQAEAIRIYTTQKKLGRDAELSAAEIVRRAERGLGIAIRRGQEEGELYPGRGRPAVKAGDTSIYQKVADVAQMGRDILSRDIYPMADGVTDDQFDAAIAEAKEEGNLSRANVVRKVKGEKREPKSVHYGRRHIDHYRVLSVTVSTLEGAMMGLRLLDVSSIPEGERAEWGDQLREALRPLALFAKEMSP